MKRRVFLKRGLFGGALLAVAAAGVALIPGDRSVRPTGPLHVFSPAAFSVLAALAARVLKGTSANPVEIAMRVDASVQRAPPEVGKDLGSALLLLENALPGLLLRGSPKPFSMLDGDAQDRAFHAWRDSRLLLLRGAYHGLRKICLAAHYATLEAGPEVGYSGPLLTKAAPPPIEARAPLAVPDGADAPGVEPLPAGTKGI
jgi:hypothetical protein